jgi:hypothetical protein
VCVCVCVWKLRGTATAAAFVLIPLRQPLSNLVRFATLYPTHSNTLNEVNQ